MSEKNIGMEIYDFAHKIFPICRSITGEGVRQTLKILQEYVECDGIRLTIHEVPSGTQAFDWTVPKEWKIREAYIEDALGKRIVDMAENNLHVMGYSMPVDTWVTLGEMKKHVFTQPDQPNLIPYVTSYYKERYGFCMSADQLNSLSEGRYHMYIDSEMFDGSLTYGEIVLQGRSEKEIFFSTYVCHPSMANNECSGLALSAQMVRYLAGIRNRRYTYRFLYIPETIGAITYLSRAGNLRHLKNQMVGGFNLSCVGDDRDYSIIESRYGDTLADKVLKNVLKSRSSHTVYPFLDRGSDERQFNAPGIDLPVVCFCRTKFGEYPEYHTSADNMNLVSAKGFQGSYEVMTEVIDVLENNYNYKVTVLCEPQLGKRGLYPTVSQKGSYDAVKAMTDLIAYADGRNDLIDISNRICVEVKELIPVIKNLKEHGLLEK